jgi:hypothetical protein
MLKTCSKTPNTKFHANKQVRGIHRVHADGRTDGCMGAMKILVAFQNRFASESKIDCCRESNVFYGSRILITALTD